MKKILLSSSALAAVALTSGAASADVELSVGGNIEYAYMMYDNDTPNPKSVDLTNPDYDPDTSTRKLPFSRRGHDVKGNDWSNEIHWTAKGTADNGLTYTGRIDWRYQANEIDEAWIKLGGGWGSFYIGQDDSVGSNVVDADSIASGSGGIDGNYFGAASDRIGKAGTMGFAGGSGDAAKIGYFSPDFGGFGFGVSYTPTNANGDGNTIGVGPDNIKDKKPTVENELSLLATYNGDFGDVNVNLGAAYQQADIKNSDAKDSSERLLRYRDHDGYHIGGIVKFADFSLAAGYIDRGDGGQIKDAPDNKADNGSGYNLGIAYDMGDLNLAMVYTSTEAADDKGKDDELEAWSIGAKYKVAEGLSTFIDVGQVETTDANGGIDGKSIEVTTTNIIVGTKISF